MLTGFVRVKHNVVWYHDKIGVIANSDRGKQREWYWVRFGNGKPMCFYANELEQMETAEAQRILQEQSHESAKS